MNEDIFCNNFYNTLQPGEQDKYPVVQAYIKHRDVVPLLKVMFELWFKQLYWARLNHDFSLQ